MIALTVLAYPAGIVAGTVVGTAASVLVLKKTTRSGYSEPCSLLPQEKSTKSSIPTLAEIVGM